MDNSEPTSSQTDTNATSDSDLVRTRVFTEKGREQYLEQLVKLLEYEDKAWSHIESILMDLDEKEHVIKGYRILKWMCNVSN